MLNLCLWPQQLLLKIVAFRRKAVNLPLVDPALRSVNHNGHDDCDAPQHPAQTSVDTVFEEEFGNLDPVAGIDSRPNSQTNNQKTELLKLPRTKGSDSDGFECPRPCLLGLIVLSLCHLLVASHTRVHC